MLLKLENIVKLQGKIVCLQERREDNSDVMWDHNGIVKTTTEKYRGKLCVCVRDGGKCYRS